MSICVGHVDTEHFIFVTDFQAHINAERTMCVWVCVFPGAGGEVHGFKREL